MQAYKDNQWYQQPVGTGKGVELVTEFIKPIEARIATPEDLATYLKQVLGVVWMYGQDPQREFFGPPRNGLGQIKIQCSGQIELLIVLPAKIPESAGKHRLEPHYDNLDNALRNLNAEDMKELSDLGALFHCVHTPWSALYIPPGAYVLEKVRTGESICPNRNVPLFLTKTQRQTTQTNQKGNLVYGVRKAVLPRDDLSAKSYMWLITAYTASKKPLGKMCDAHAAMLPKSSETLPPNNGADADGSEVVSLSAEPAAASSEKNVVTAQEEKSQETGEKDPNPATEKDPDPATEKASASSGSALDNAAAKASDEKVVAKASAKAAAKAAAKASNEKAAAKASEKDGPPAKRPKGAKP